MFKNLFTYKGRIRRTEYAISAMVIVMLIGFVNGELKESPGSIFYLILSLNLFVAWTIQAAKRSHDIGYSAWWLLLPFYGFWLLFSKGEKGPNIYGEDPKRTISMNDLN